MTNVICKPTPVGEMITEWFLKPLNMSVDDLAKKMRYTGFAHPIWCRSYMQGIIDGDVNITVRDAIALGKALKTSAEFWLNIRNNNDLWAVREAQGLNPNTGKKKRSKR